MTPQPMTTTPDVLIFVVPQKLSDGSDVFNVHLGQYVCPAVTHDDAVALANKIADAISYHTNLTADVVEE